MRFELLGSLRVLDGGCDLTPARPKQRALLALLVLRRGEVVAGAQLIEALWGEDPPGSAQNALHGHVSALRKLLGAERIRTRPPGYLLSAAADEVDVARFELLVGRARARGDPGDRSAGLRDALALWRGEPLADLRGEPFAEREIARLEELRLAALEDRIDADLAAGRHFELVAELETLVAEHVFRERLRGQLMLALYRCGRQADALHAFQSGRRALVEQLGLEPGPALQQLELQILRQDPSLELTARARRAVPVRYARSGDLNIAYQVTGDGPLDVVLISGFLSHLEKDWEEPGHARFLERLGSIARLIRFDKRGTGLSDRPPGLPDLETRMDDVRAVMDAVSSRRAVLFGYSESGPMAILFAATYPERTRALVLYGAYAKRLDPDDDYPWAPTREARAAYIERLERDWGFESDMKMMCPSADDALARWWGERCRAAASPGAIRALNEMNSLIDVRALLPAIRVPTLVVHRGTDYDVRVEEGRYIAERIRGARFVELPGADHFVGVDSDQILDVVEPFLAQCGAAAPAPPDDRVLVTLLYADVADAPTEVVRAELGRHRGREVERRGGGLLASFDGPARAVRCATAIAAAGVGARAGVHTGEVELVDGHMRGIALDVAVAIATAAAPGEVLVSQTVSDLVAGSGLEFADRGSRVPGAGRLLAVAGADRQVAAPLVGRAEELEVLERALDRARSGAGSTVLVAGDAGIGKTRLVSELAARARAAGFQVLVGRCLDLVGTELPYQPFVGALRTLGRELPFVEGGSQLRVFEETLALLDGLAPVLLVLEDVHWADMSTLDLVAYLAHNADERRVLLVATYRADEPASAERLRRLAATVRRSTAARALELGPLAPDELITLIEARAGITRIGAGRRDHRPLRGQPVLRRGAVGRGERRARRAPARPARSAAATGGAPGPPDQGRAARWLLRPDATSASASCTRRRRCRSPTCATRCGGPSSTACSSAERDSFRFRHALLAEAIYATLLPGSARRCTRSSPTSSRAAIRRRPRPSSRRTGQPPAGRRRRSSRRSRRHARRRRSSAWPRRWRTSSARSRCGPTCPDAAEPCELDLAELSSWAAERAILTGAAPRAVELGRQARRRWSATAIRCAPGSCTRASAATCCSPAAATPRSPRTGARVELVPPEPPSAERARGSGGARACADADLVPRRVACDL